MYRAFISLLVIYTFIGFSGALSIPEASAQPRPNLTELYNEPSLLNRSISALLYLHQIRNVVRTPEPTSGSFEDLLGDNLLTEQQLSAILQLTNCHNPQALTFTAVSADEYSITIRESQCEPKTKPAKPSLSEDGQVIFFKNNAPGHQK